MNLNFARLFFRMHFILPVSVVILIFFLVYIVVRPSYRISFQDITNIQDMELLRSYYEDIQHIETWTPRFASSSQIQLLVARIYSGKEKKWNELLRKVESASSLKAKGGLEFQNCLVIELMNSQKCPSLETLRTMKKEKCKKLIEKRVFSILKNKRENSFLRVMGVVPEMKETSTSSVVNVRLDALNSLLEKFHVPLYPENHWWNRFTGGASSWRASYKKAVEKDVLPVLEWYRKVDSMSELNLRNEGTDKCFLQLIQNEVPVLERYRVWGNYSLFLCERGETGLNRKYDTGIRFIRTRILQENDRSLSSDQKWTVFPTQSNEKAVFEKTEPSYGTQDVTQFLRTLGMSDVFRVRFTKEKISPDCSSIHLEFILEHDEFPNWKSNILTLQFGTAECDLNQLRAQMNENLQKVRQSLWETMKDTKVFHGFQFSAEAQSFETSGSVPMEAFHKNAVLTAGKYCISVQQFLDKLCCLHTSCQPNSEEKEQLCQLIIASNAEKLETFDGFLHIQELKLTGNHIEGVCVIDTAAFETQDEIPLSDRSFDFWVLSDGTLETQTLKFWEKLETLKTKSLPPAPADLTPEMLKEKVSEFLSREYPKLSHYIHVVTGRNGKNCLWYKMNVQISDYPELELGPAFVQDTANVEQEAEELFETLQSVSENQWNVPYEHPRYGKVSTSITSWSPSRLDCVGTLNNQVLLFGSTVPFCWSEELQLDENTAWHYYSTSEVGEEFSSQMNSIREVTEKVLLDLYETEFIISEESTDDWIQFYPLKFSMFARCVKPLQLPFSFEVGKVRISAYDVEFPKRYQLTSDDTFWFPIVGITAPKFDLDLERKRLSASASFTPSVPELFQREASAYAKSFGENQEGSKLSAKEAQQELLRLGIPLEKPNPIDVLEEDVNALFYPEMAENVDSDNPWYGWMRADLAGLGDLAQKHYGASGALYVARAKNASLSGYLEPKCLDLSGHLSTRVFNSETEDSSEEWISEDISADESGSYSSPLMIDGGIRFTETEKKLNLSGNFLGFIAGGMGRIYSDYNQKQSLGVSVDGVLASLCQKLGVTGDISFDAKKYTLEGNGILLHPFMKCFGTVQYGITIWKHSQTDKGIRLFLKWISKDGKEHIFEGEFPDANAIDVGEIAQTMKKIEELDAELAEASAAENQQFSVIGNTYPEVVRAAEKENALDESNLNEAERIRLQLKKGLEISNLQKRLADTVNSGSVSENEDSQSSQTSEPYVQVGEVECKDDGNYVDYFLIETGEILFHLKKSDLNISFNLEASDARLGIRKNGSGYILLRNMENLITTRPCFYRIFCSSSQTVSSVEVISSASRSNYGSYSASAKSWMKIEGLFNDLPGSPRSMQEILEYALAHQTAFWVLTLEIEDEVFDVLKEGLISSFSTKNKKGDVFHYIFSYQYGKFMMGMIPGSVLSEKRSLEKVRSFLMQPNIRSEFPEIFYVGAHTIHDGKDLVLVLTLTPVTFGIGVQVRSEETFSDVSQAVILEKSWSIKKEEDIYSWILQQHINGTIPIAQNVKYFLGGEGLAAVRYEGSTPVLSIIPIKRIQKEIIAPPLVLTRERWEKWGTDTEHFLPEDLQNEAGRQKEDFEVLAGQTVTLWNPKTSKWQCAPMGLLAGLIETLEEKRGDAESNPQK